MSIFHVEDGFFGQPKGTGGLQHHKFLILDGKQHPKKHLTSVLKNFIASKTIVLKLCRYPQFGQVFFALVLSLKQDHL